MTAMLTPEEQEYEEIGERLNDIEAHFQGTRWDMPEWKALCARQRELESAVHPTGEEMMTRLSDSCRQ